MGWRGLFLWICTIFRTANCNDMRRARRYRNISKFWPSASESTKTYVRVTAQVQREGHHLSHTFIYLLKSKRHHQKLTYCSHKMFILNFFFRMKKKHPVDFTVATEPINKLTLPVLQRLLLRCLLIITAGKITWQVKPLYR